MQQFLAALATDSNLLASFLANPAYVAGQWLTAEESAVLLSGDVDAINASLFDPPAPQSATAEPQVTPQASAVVEGDMAGITSTILGVAPTVEDGASDHD